MTRSFAALSFLAATFLLACSTGSEPASVPSPADATPEDAKVERLELVAGERSGFVSFVATKNEGVEVPGRFMARRGSLGLTGGDLSTLTGGIDVSLETVDTLEVARDTSLREALFEIGAGAAGKARVDVLSIVPHKKTMAPGERTAATAKLKIGILGGGATVDASVEIGRIGKSRWSVRSVEPVQLSLEGLGMAAQAAALKERCKHDKLGDAVAVSFVLGFRGAGGGDESPAGHGGGDEPAAGHGGGDEPAAGHGGGDDPAAGQGGGDEPAAGQGGGGGI